MWYVTNAANRATTDNLRNSTGQDTSTWRLLWKPKIYYCVHMIPPLVHILQFTPAYTFLPFLGLISMLSSHPRYGLYRCLSLQVFWRNSVSYFSHAHYMPRSSHSFWFHGPDNFWQRLQILKILIIQISLVPSRFLPIRSKYSPQHPVFKHLFYIAPLMLEIKLHMHTKQQVKFWFCTLKSYF
jgi:hypothetical protein